MSTQTTNFGLNKDEGNNWYDVNKVNSNTDIIDTALGNTAKFEKAGGTAAAITVTGVTIADGHSKTFIVKANNNGTATTINGKPLYKPGTTSAPSLTTGKAVTVWYDLTGDCFFIKASAEGDAVAANVLAGKKFSNDNDTGITGTMANNGAVTITPGTAEQVITAGYHNGSGKVVGDADLASANIKAGVDIFGVTGKPSVVDTADANAVAGNILSGKTGYVNGAKITGTIASKAAATITPGTTDQTIAAGQYLSGTQTIKGDANLVAAKIEKGTTIFNVAGTLDTRQLNFPLSIQDAQPTPVRAGHIWVKSASLGSLITKVKILEAVNAGETDGTLMFVVGDLALHSMSFNNTIDVNGATQPVSVADTTLYTADWEILSKEGMGGTHSYKINRPLVYSKVGGVLDIETAYFWTGSKWIMLCQSGKYALFNTTLGSTYNLRIFNRTSDTSVISNTVFTNYTKTINMASGDGTYLLYTSSSGVLSIIKRVGDIFTPLYYTLPATHINGSITGTVGSVYLCADGTLLVGYYVLISGYYSYYAVVYRDNGTTFVSNYITPTIATSYNYQSCNIIGNRNCSAFSFIVCTSGVSSSNDNYLMRTYFGSGISYTVSTSILRFSSNVGMNYSYDGKYLLACGYNYVSGMNYNTCFKITLDYALKTAISTIAFTHNNTLFIGNSHPAGYMIIDHGNETSLYRLTDMVKLGLSFSSGVSTPRWENISFSLDGQTALVGQDTSGTKNALLFSVTIGTNVTFNLIQTIDAANQYSFSTCLIPY